MAILFPRFNLARWQWNLVWLDGLLHGGKWMWLVQERVSKRMCKVTRNGWIRDVAGKLT